MSVQPRKDMKYECSTQQGYEILVFNPERVPNISVQPSEGIKYEFSTKKGY